jgi:hypothetical protein
MARAKRSGLNSLGVVSLLIGLGALALAGYYSGALPQWWAKFFPKPPVPAAAPEPLVTDSSDEPRAHSIFDAPGSYTNSGDSHRSGSPAPVNLPPASPTILAPHPGSAVASPPAIPAPSGLTIPQARAKLDAATAALERSLANDPAYVQAKKNVVDAEAKRKAALAADDPGSPSVMEASGQWLDAKTKLRKLLDAAGTKDPAMAAAQQALKDAESNARGTK